MSGKTKNTVDDAFLVVLSQTNRAGEAEGLLVESIRDRERVVRPAVPVGGTAVQGLPEGTRFNMGSLQLLQ